MLSLSGNVLTSRWTVVMGAAFGGVMTALVKDLITPFIAAEEMWAKSNPFAQVSVLSFVGTASHRKLLT